VGWQTECWGRFGPMHIEIRNETALDIPAIEDVTRAAFLNAPYSNHYEQFKELSRMTKRLADGEKEGAGLMLELDHPERRRPVGLRV
jgi:predicted N-acetyltransferase YhbS